MQADPRYAHVLLDVFDSLEQRLAAAEAAGIPRSHLIVDPGIGFGKTATHNLHAGPDTPGLTNTNQEALAARAARRHHADPPREVAGLNGAHR